MWLVFNFLLKCRDYDCLLVSELFLLSDFWHVLNDFDPGRSNLIRIVFAIQLSNLLICSSSRIHLRSSIWLSSHLELGIISISGRCDWLSFGHLLWLNFSHLPWLGFSHLPWLGSSHLLWLSSSDLLWLGSSHLLWLCLGYLL